MREVTCTITSKGRVTVPKPVREALGVEPGDRITFVAHDSGQVEVRKARYTLKDLRGIVPAIPGRESDTFDDMFEEAFQERADYLMSGYRETEADQA
jgi:AbrB family looped-hinge helix DNA binding protein